MEPVNTRMPWEEVKTRLQWQRRREYPVAPSPAYADARNGATPSSLVVFERPQSSALGTVYFQTNQGKGGAGQKTSASEGWKNDSSNLRCSPAAAAFWRCRQLPHYRTIYS